jgi:DNA-binding transcriptional LysR family regulator
VAGGVADLGCILSNDPVPGLTSRVIGWQEMVFAAAATHPLARRRAIDPASLAREPFVGPPADSLFGRNVAALLAGIGLPRVRQVSQATEYPFLRRLVAAEVGLCFTLRCSVAADVAAGDLAVLDVVAPRLGLQVREVTAPGHPVPPAVERFRGFLAQYDFGRAPG